MSLTNMNAVSGQALLFENEWGDGDLITAEEINKIIQSVNHEIELVFVAACDSKIVGEIFKKN